VIDSREEQRNTFNFRRVDFDSVSNEMNESDWQCAKRDEHRIWIQQGIGINVIRLLWNARGAIPVTHSAAVGEEKKIDEGTKIAAAYSRKTQNLTFAMIKAASSILINCSD
jgi:hypothetical protein